MPSPPQAGEGFKQFLTEFFEAFPDMCTTVEHIVAENNLVTVFLNGSGTHKGIFKGVPPTNKQVNIRSADLYKIENGILHKLLTLLQNFTRLDSHQVRTRRQKYGHNILPNIEQRSTVQILLQSV